MRIKLTYFKSTGKFYSEGSYETDESSSFWDVIAEVRAMAEGGYLPGLHKGVKDLHTLVEVPDEPQRGAVHMIWAGGKISTDYN